MQSFSVQHLTYLAVEIVLLAVLLPMVARMPKAKAQRLVSRLGVVVMLAYILPVIIVCLIDAPQSKWINNLPLHLCSAASIFLPIGLWTKNKLLLNVSYSLGVPGAAFALATPESWYSSFSWFSLHFFLFNVSHFVLVFTPIAAICAGVFKPQFKYAPRVIGFGVAATVAVYPINKWLGTNYLFANWPEPNTILVPMADVLGVPWYLLGVAALGAAMICLMYGLRWLSTRFDRHKTQPDGPAIVS